MNKKLVTLVKEIQELYEKLGTWGAVGNHYGVHRTVVWRIVKDNYEPKDNHVRSLLGLSEIVQREVFRDEEGRFARQPNG